MTLASPARSLLGRALERVALLIDAFSGPFSVVFSPLFIWRALRERSKDAVTASLIVVSDALVQAFVYVFIVVRVPAQVAYSFIEWLQLIASRIAIEPIIGARLLVNYERSPD